MRVAARKCKDFPAPFEYGGMDTNAKSSDVIEAKLGLWDAVSIIVGIIIGVGIFETPPHVFKRIQEPWVILTLWTLCGLVSLIGALCFAELASAYPRSGGEYVYLTRAFGPLAGFLFAWAQLTVIRSGSIAIVAYIFGYHAAALLDLDNTGVFVLAGMSVIVLTMINLLGVTLGTRTQNILTLAKVLGLAAIVVVGFGWGRGEIDATSGISPSAGALAGAMMIILWTYAGWHEAAYIVSEARNRTRNIPLALILGTLVVTTIYLLVNLAYLIGLDSAELNDPQGRCAALLVNRFWPGYGSRVIDTLIVVSSLGAMNGSIFTTARIYSEFGTDHRLFSALSYWSKRWKTPIRALVAQGFICLALIAGVWTIKGDRDSFEAAVSLTAAVFWFFFFLTGCALIRLRLIDPDTPRPFRVPGYPLLPILFCASCAYMIAGTILFDALKSLIGMLILLVGLPFYFIPKKLSERHAEKELQPVSKSDFDP
jgi:amino acid transporter